MANSTGTVFLHKNRYQCLSLSDEEAPTDAVNSNVRELTSRSTPYSNGQSDIQTIQDNEGGSQQASREKKKKHKKEMKTTEIINEVETKSYNAEIEVNQSPSERVEQNRITETILYQRETSRTAEKNPPMAGNINTRNSNNERTKQKKNISKSTLQNLYQNLGRSNNINKTRQQDYTSKLGNMTSTKLFNTKTRKDKQKQQNNNDCHSLKPSFTDIQTILDNERVGQEASRKKKKKHKKEMKITVTINESSHKVETKSYNTETEVKENYLGRVEQKRRTETILYQRETSRTAEKNPPMAGNINTRNSKNERKKQKKNISKSTLQNLYQNLGRSNNMNKTRQPNDSSELENMTSAKLFITKACKDKQKQENNNECHSLKPSAIDKKPTPYTTTYSTPCDKQQRKNNTTTSEAYSPEECEIPHNQSVLHFKNDKLQGVCQQETIPSIFDVDTSKASLRQRYPPTVNILKETTTACTYSHSIPSRASSSQRKTSQTENNMRKKKTMPKQDNNKSTTVPNWVNMVNSIVPTCEKNKGNNTIHGAWTTSETKCNRILISNQRGHFKRNQFKRNDSSTIFRKRRCDKYGIPKPKKFHNQRKVMRKMHPSDINGVQLSKPVKCKRRSSDILEALIEGREHISNFPALTLVKENGNWASINTVILEAFQKYETYLQKAGTDLKVPVIYWDYLSWKNCSKLAKAAAVKVKSVRTKPLPRGEIRIKQHKVQDFQLRLKKGRNSKRFKINKPELAGLRKGYDFYIDENEIHPKPFRKLTMRNCKNSLFLGRRKTYNHLSMANSG